MIVLSIRAKQSVRVLFLILLVYTGIHLLGSFSGVGALRDLMQGRADPLLFSVFNLFGVFAAAFLVHALYTLEYISPRKRFGLALGFLIGAFALLPTYGYGSFRAVYRPRRGLKAISAGLAVLAAGLIGYGLLFGSPATYFETFATDSFTHIMTIDFLALYVLSVLLARFASGRWWWVALLPVAGFSLSLLLSLVARTREKNQEGT